MHRSLLYHKCVGTLALDFVTTPVTTAAWVQLVSSLPAAFDAVEIFNSSNAALQLAIAPSGHEDDNNGQNYLQYNILPGKSSPQIPLTGPKGGRLAAKALGSVNADAGDLYINFFG